MLASCAACGMLVCAYTLGLATGGQIISILSAFCYCCCPDFVVVGLHRLFTEIAKGQANGSGSGALFPQVNSWRETWRSIEMCGFKVAGASHSRSGEMRAELVVVEYFVVSRPPCTALLTDCDRLPWHWQVERLHGNCNSSRPTSTYNWTWSRR